MLFAIAGNWCCPYISARSAAFVARIRRAGMSGAQLCSCVVNVSPQTSLFAMFLCLFFRAASGFALPLRSGAINSSGPYPSAFRATFAVRAKQGRNVWRAALLMSCYHIASNVSMASVPALLQASFYLCDQGQLIPTSAF